MPRFVAVGLLLAALAGCASSVPYAGPTQQPAGGFSENPVFLPHGNHEHVWETVVDVVDDHFKIEREEPVRLIGDVLTEGRLDTFPLVGSTVFEPWRGDSANGNERLESTLQSIRRRAEVRVIPDQGGYWVDVAVFKELEDAVRPAEATAGEATFRHDGTLNRVAGPVGRQQINDGWVPLGRDAALEQRIVGQLQTRVATPPGGYPF